MTTDSSQIATAGSPEASSVAEPQAETLIRVDGLSKRYGSIQAVDSVSFEVKRGEVLAFLGPNGAGKTTVMKMITGFLEPDSGRAFLCGHDVRTGAVEARRSLGYLPENAPAYGDMTPHEFLKFIADVRDLDQPGAAIDRVVEMTELGGVMGQPIETLSKGFQRRVGLAQALIHDPAVLILDEPTDGLDPNQKAMVQELLSGLKEDRCIVLSTHILDEAERIASRALILSEGRIVSAATPAELIARAPGHNTVRVVFSIPVPVDLAIEFQRLPWCAGAVVTGTELEIEPADGGNHLPEVLDRLNRRDQSLGLQVIDVRLTEGRLDDLFRQVTRGVAA